MNKLLHNAGKGETLREQALSSVFAVCRFSKKGGCGSNPSLCQLRGFQSSGDPTQTQSRVRSMRVNDEVGG